MCDPCQSKGRSMSLMSFYTGIALVNPKQVICMHIPSAKPVELSI